MYLTAALNLVRVKTAEFSDPRINENVEEDSMRSSSRENMSKIIKRARNAIHLDALWSRI
jgi:hypothetical protein